jgi:hypothetical protein
MDLQVAGRGLRRREINVGRSTASQAQSAIRRGQAIAAAAETSKHALAGSMLVLLYGGTFSLNVGDSHGRRVDALLTWSGTGKPVTARGDYPLVVTIRPASHFRGCTDCTNRWRGRLGLVMEALRVRYVFAYTNLEQR